MRRLVCLAAALLPVVACGADAPPTPCRVPGLVHEARCGSVQRPLDPSAPAGRHIAVHYVVVPALARGKQPDPVFLIAGGPGQSAIGVAPDVMPLFERLNNRRDIVFVDQRGTGRSAPLVCDEGAPRSLAAMADVQRQIEQLRQCRETLAALPYLGEEAGLRFFTTAIAMQDLDAVRRALGAGRINLVGVSYGTRAALDYQRQFPAHLRRSVLDGVAPPDLALPASFGADAQAVLDTWFAACRDDAGCAAQHPRLRDDWQALLAGLPRPVTMRHPLDGHEEHVELTQDLLLGAVRAALYQPAQAAALPAAIAEAAAGRPQALVALGMPGANRRGDVAAGMHFSVMCAEDLPLLADAVERPGPGIGFGAGIARLYRRVCADWPRGDVPAGFRDIAPSAVPVLLLSGGLDPVTPPRHAERAAQALGAMARHVVVPNAGHGVLALGCMRELLWRFIAAETPADALAVDADCAASLPRPGVFQPVALPR